MTIYIYHSVTGYSACAFEPHPVVGFSASTPTDALINLAKHQCLLPPHLTDFSQLADHFIANYTPTLHATFPNTSFTSIREDFPEFFI